MRTRPDDKMSREFWQNHIMQRRLSTQWDSMNHSSDMVTRAEQSTSSGMKISLPVVISIAIGGFAVVVISLVAAGCYLTRRHIKRPSRYIRRQSLDDGNSVAAEELRSNPIALGREPPFPLLPSWLNPKTQGLGEETNDRTTHTRIDSPSRNFRVSNPRDSWPLDSWSMRGADSARGAAVGDLQEAQNGQRVDDFRIIRSDISTLPRVHTRQTSIVPSHFALAQIDTRPNTQYGISMGGDGRSKHFIRRSMSENQLTTILQTTSQRLRLSESSRQSRAVNIMNCTAGPAPIVTPPSPLPSSRNTSRDVLLLDKSSITKGGFDRHSLLSMSSHDSSVKGLNTPDYTTYDTRHSPLAMSADDSFCRNSSSASIVFWGSSSPTIKTPTDDNTILESQSKDVPLKVSRDDEHNTLSDTPGGLQYSRSYHRKSLLLQNDSLWSQHSVRSKSNNPAPSSDNNLEKSASGAIEMSPIEPLRIVSGNSAAKSQNEQKALLSKKQTELPKIRLPKDASKVFRSSKDSGVAKRGHRRSQTVRIAGVLSSPKNGTAMQKGFGSDADTGTPIARNALPVVQNSSPDLTISLQSPSSPSVTTLLSETTSQALPCPRPASDSARRAKRASRTSYSLSVYDYYSDFDLCRTKAEAKNSRELEDFKPATISNQTYRRHGELLSSKTDLKERVGQPSLNMTSIPPLPPPTDVPVRSLSPLTEEEPALPPPMSPLRLNPSHRFSRTATAPYHLNGPRSPPSSPPKQSLVSSVNELRRANSQLSHYTPVGTPMSSSPQRSSTITVIPPLPQELLQFSDPPTKSPTSSPTQSRSSGVMRGVKRSASERGSPRRGGSRRIVRVDEAIAEEIRSSPPTMNHASEVPPSNSISPETMANFPKDDVAGSQGCGIGGRSSNKQVILALPGHYDPSNKPDRDSQDSIASSLNLGIGLGLRLTGDGSPRSRRRRKDSLWGAESVRGSAWQPSTTDFAMLPKIPLTLPSSESKMGQESPSRDSPERQKSIGSAGRRVIKSSPASSRGRGVVGLGIYIEEDSKGMTPPVWGEKWRRSLGLYDEDGFLRSSPRTGNSPLQEALKT